MSRRWDRVASGIKSFVENPITNLVKGVVLASDRCLRSVARRFRDDLAHGHLRVGHGMIIIGLFSILDALPHLISSMEAWEKYVELRDKRAKAREEGRP